MIDVDTKNSLIENSELLSIFIKESPIFSFIQEVTPEGCIAVFCSDSFKKLTGISGHEMIGKTMEELFPPELAAKINADNWTVITKGQVIEIDEELNGRQYKTIKFPIRQKNRKFVAGYILDVTERKQAEKNLKESEERLSLSLEAFKAGCWDWDIESGRLVWSKTMFTLFGLEPETVEASFEVWKKIVHPDDYEVASKNIEKAIRDKSSLLNEYRILLSTGEVRWISAIGQCSYNHTGKPLRMVGICTDITDRKQAEKEKIENQVRFQEVLENRLDASYKRDLKTNSYEYLSPVFFRLSGFTVDEMFAMTTESVIKRMHPDDVVEVSRIFAEVVPNPKIKQQELIYRFKHKNGQYLWFLDRFTITRDESGQPLALVGSVRDITENKKAEIENEALRIQMFHASKLASLGTLSAGIAHEINNPLTILSLNNDILEESCSKACPKDKLNQILKSKTAIQRITKIVSGLQTFARSDSEDLEQVDVHNCLHETFEIVKGLYEKENIEIEEHLNARKYLVNANMGKLQQVILNLYSNAKDALQGIKEGKIITSTENQNNSLIIRISDNGAGISAKHLSKIFDPFFTTKAPGKGTGIGLSISKTILKSFNGEIRVESLLGKGTSFYIEMPSLLQEKLVTTSAVEAISKFSFAGKSLIIDDESAIRSILCSHLEKLGMSVVSAQNGAEGLEFLKKENFDYVFTDMKMPIMSGDIFLQEAVKFKQAKTKFLVMSGGFESDFTSEQKERLRQCPHAYLQKPFDRASIFKALLAVAALK